MRKLMCVAALAGFFAVPVLAQEGQNRAGNPAGRRKYSYAESHQVLQFLELTDEQKAKIDALWTDFQAASRELYQKNRPGRGASNEERQAFYKAVGVQRKALQEDFDLKVLDILTDEQKKKYEAVQEANAAFQKAQREFLIKFTNEREDKILGILGDVYKERAEQIKKGMRGEFNGSDTPGGGLYRHSQGR